VFDLGTRLKGCQRSPGGRTRAGSEDLGGDPQHLIGAVLVGEAGFFSSNVRMSDSSGGGSLVKRGGQGTLLGSRKKSTKVY